MKGKASVLGRAALIFVVLTTFLPAHAESSITKESQSLPQPFVDELNNESCTIQPLPVEGELGIDNRISGTLATNAQTDWAVLCTRIDGHYIRIYWGGPKTCDSRIDIETSLLDSTTRTEYTSDRALGVANRDYILAHYRYYGGPKPPRIDHEGINYIYVGKASVVFYCYEGEWVALTGAD